MKVLTLHQPWATLVAIGAKKIETRCWKTNYRGELGIHAAAGIPQYARNFFVAHVQNSYGLDGLTINDLPLGAILCVVNLTGCVPVEDIKGSLSHSELLFGDYSSDAGRYAWTLENVRVYYPPIKAKGLQRIWNWEFPVAP